MSAATQCHLGASLRLSSFLLWPPSPPSRLPATQSGRWDPWLPRCRQWRRGVLIPSRILAQHAMDHQCSGKSPSLSPTAYGSCTPIQAIHPGRPSSANCLPSPIAVPGHFCSLIPLSRTRCHGTSPSPRSWDGLPYSPFPCFPSPCRLSSLSTLRAINPNVP